MVKTGKKSTNLISRAREALKKWGKKSTIRKIPKLKIRTVTPRFSEPTSGFALRRLYKPEEVSDSSILGW